MNAFRLRNRTVVAPAAAAIGLLATACSSMKMEFDGAMRLEGPIRIVGPVVEFEGVYISQALLDRVETGKTTVDWVVAAFGEPTDVGRLDDGSEIWKWSYKPIGEQGAMVRVLSDEKSAGETHVTAFVHIRNGVVVEKWRG